MMARSALSPSYRSPGSANVKHHSSSKQNGPAILGTPSELVLSSDHLNSHHSSSKLISSPLSASNAIKSQQLFFENGPNQVAAAAPVNHLTNTAGLQISFPQKPQQHSTSSTISNVILANPPHNFNSLYIQSPQHLEKQQNRGATQAVILTSNDQHVLAAPSNPGLLSSASLTMLSPQTSQQLYGSNIAASGAAPSYFLTQGHLTTSHSAHQPQTYTIDPSSATALYLLEASGTPSGLALKSPPMPHHHSTHASSSVPAAGTK